MIEEGAGKLPNAFLAEGAAAADADSDGASNLHEFLAGTNPKNGSSVLAMSVVPEFGGTGFVLAWQSVTGKFYRVECGSNLIEGLNANLTNHIGATPPMNVHTDKTASGNMRFYRIVVE